MTILNTCSICGEPMAEAESMFKFHGSLGPCPKPPLPAPAWQPSPAENALLLFEAYERMPADRGGVNGPKGLAWQAFVDAKSAALEGKRP